MSMWIAPRNVGWAADPQNSCHCNNNVKQTRLMFHRATAVRETSSKHMWFRCGAHNLFVYVHLSVAAYSVQNLCNHHGSTRFYQVK
jgi:hypothetical protein